jgi:hypothetical protein
MIFILMYNSCVIRMETHAFNIMVPNEIVSDGVDWIHYERDNVRLL